MKFSPRQRYAANFTRLPSSSFSSFLSFFVVNDITYSGRESYFFFQKESYSSEYYLTSNVSHDSDLNKKKRKKRKEKGRGGLITHSGMEEEPLAEEGPVGR